MYKSNDLFIIFFKANYLLESLLHVVLEGCQASSNIVITFIETYILCCELLPVIYQHVIVVSKVRIEIFSRAQRDVDMVLSGFNSFEKVDALSDCCDHRSDHRNHESFKRISFSGLVQVERNDEEHEAGWEYWKVHGGLSFSDDSC